METKTLADNKNSQRVFGMEKCDAFFHKIEPQLLEKCTEQCRLKPSGLVPKDFWEYWKSKQIPLPTSYYYCGGENSCGDTDNICKAVRRIVPHYDVGVGIASGGMFPAYMFDRHGLPVLIVKQQASHLGPNEEATWEPIDEITKETIEDKRVLVIELDVLHGRTLRRTKRELSKLSPATLDLFLQLGPKRLLINGRFGDFRDSDVRHYIPEGFGKIYFLNELQPRIGEEEQPIQMLED